MKYIVLLLWVLPVAAIGQQPLPIEEHPDKMTINKTIYRLSGTLALAPELIIDGSVEREIIRPMTALLKAGPAFSREYINRDIWGNEQFRYSVKAAVSGELRYYYNLYARTRKGKTVRNYSANYISIEPFLQSSPLVFLNKNGSEVARAKSGIYFNTGLQRQVNNTTYYKVYAGTRLPGKNYNNTVDFMDVVQAGLSIGRVF